MTVTLFATWYSRAHTQPYLRTAQRMIAKKSGKRNAAAAGLAAKATGESQATA
jgi:hypothetical protein